MTENQPPLPRPRSAGALLVAGAWEDGIPPLPRADTTREDWNGRFVLGHGWQPSVAAGDDWADPKRNYGEELEAIAGTKLRGQMRVLRDAAAGGAEGAEAEGVVDDEVEAVGVAQREEGGEGREVARVGVEALDEDEAAAALGGRQLLLERGLYKV